MTTKRLPDSVAELVERQVTAEELQDVLTVPLSDEERERTLELVRWFRRRYPTPLERLAYVRQAYRRWTAGRR
jgi:hypothetical protein